MAGGDSSRSDDESDNEACCACGVRVSEDDDEEEDRKFFLCDSCPRCMCSSCVAQAHRSTNEVRRIENDHDGRWECSHCNPPRFLSALQKLHLCSTESNNVSASGEQVPSEETRRTVDEILNDLSTAESKKQEVIQKMDDRTTLREEMRQNIREYIGDEDYLSEGDVDLALESWVEDGMEKLQRYDDFISGLHDELEVSHGLDIYKIYQSADDGNETGMSKQRLLYEKADNDEDDDDDPAWKRQADREIRKREAKLNSDFSQAKKKERGNDGSSNHDVGLLDLDEIEDLGSIEEDSAAEEYYAPWTGPFRIRYGNSSQKTEAAEAEDAILQQSTVKVTKVFESDDEKAEKKQKLESTRVRQDVKLQLKSRKSEKKPASKKQSQSSTRRQSSSNFAAVTTKRRTIMDGPEENRQVDGMLSDDNLDDNNLGDVKGRRSLSMFQKSSLVLSVDPYIAVASELANKLKAHQRQAVQFLFNNCFPDLSISTKSAAPGGAILAHNMGLGKSLSTISLLHALLHAPLPEDKSNPKGKVDKILLVAPVNTIANWENEWDKWTKELKYRSHIENLADSSNKKARLKSISKWDERGGILLTSEALFKNIVSDKRAFKALCNPGPDVLVIDEAHLMLSKENKISSRVSTQRRILLTGSPIQNNLSEFYRLMSFVRPGVLGDSEKAFQRTYRDPIDEGMPSNASDGAKRKADGLLRDLTYKTNPYFHRRDASVLRKDLPPLTQICIHVRPTKIQRSLMSRYSKLRKSDDNAYSNFLKQYAHMQTVSNHPGTLLMKENESENNGTSQKCETDPVLEMFADDSDVEMDDTQTTEDVPDVWWKKEATKFGKEAFRDVESGNKMVVLLHILTGASRKGEKTIVFSQSLKVRYEILERNRKKWLE
jgi:SNF2 family DNA or RNA helicase